MDYAFVQLDRPARPPATRTEWTTRAAEPEEAVVVLGHPEGLPLKIDAGATIRSRADDMFTLDSDTFAGSSGSGVFDAQRALLGIVVSGGYDYVLSPDQRCIDTRVAAKTTDAERGTSSNVAIAKLCAMGWSSEPLCGRPSQCGDGQCAADEAGTACAADFPELPLPDLPREHRPASGCGVVEWDGPFDALIAATFASLFAISRARSNRRIG